MAIMFLRNVKKKIWEKVNTTMVKTIDFKYLHEKPKYIKVGTKLYKEVWGFREFERLEVYTVKRYTARGMYILTDEYNRETKAYANEIGVNKYYTFSIRERVLKKIEKIEKINEIKDKIYKLEEQLIILNKELSEI